MARSRKESASATATKRKTSQGVDVPAAKLQKKQSKPNKKSSALGVSKLNPTQRKKVKEEESKLDSPYFSLTTESNSQYFTEITHKSKSQQKEKSSSRSTSGRKKVTDKPADKKDGRVNGKQKPKETKVTSQSSVGSDRKKSVKGEKSIKKMNQGQEAKVKASKDKSPKKTVSNSTQESKKVHSKSPNKSTKNMAPLMSTGSPKKAPVMNTPMELLLQAEGNAYKPLLSSQDEEEDNDDDEKMSGSGSDESDWEAVEEVPGEREEELDLQSQVPDAAVEITLTGPDIMKKKRKRGFDMADWFRRQANRYQRETQLELHKVHLLCLLCHGFHCNAVCNNEILQGIALSLVSHDFLGRSRSAMDIRYFREFTKWFCQDYYIEASLEHSNKRMKRTLGMRLASKALASEAEMVMLYVIILRALGAQVRLVYSLQPVSHKPAPVKLKKKDPEVIDLASCHSSQDGAKPETSKSDKQPAKHSKQSPTCSKGRTERKSGNPSKSKDSSQSKTPMKSIDSTKSKPSLKLKDSQGTAKRNARKTSSGKSYKEDSGDDEDNDEGPVKQRGKATKKKKHVQEEITVSSGSDFEAERSFRSPPSAKKISRKVVSSDSDDSVQVVKSKIKEQGSDWWVEAYGEVEKKWFCVDCVRWRFNHPAEFKDHATKPMYYVVAYDNDSSVKDVTMRYTADWMSKTRKLRPDPEWWSISMLPYKSRDRTREETEDLLLQAQHLQKPLPTSIGEYKNHPLYALPRHLLKFEAIYPDTSVPLGYIRKEPVYSRDCVHVLHTRENWLKEARAVRVKEEPYKFVKGRKKRRDPMDMADPVAELFGRWQTEQYIAPPAHDGKVPRNEYGNVEMFKPCMLPAGAVHLKVPGLNKVAKKLGIDCAAAMTGWDHHSGFAHPILDGWIVCEEFEETLLCAWEEEQLIQAQKEAEKNQARILDNWKKLIRGLLIREKIKQRFNLQEPEKPHAKPSTSKSSAKSKSKHSSGEQSEKATDLEVSWPRNLQTEPAQAHPRDKGQPLFPFEKI